MSIRPFRDINRRKTKVIKVGKLSVGGDNPISVQSMTNTLTTDVNATIKQIHEIQNEGADLVRVSCPDESSSKSLKEIIEIISKMSNSEYRVLVEEINEYYIKKSNENIENFKSLILDI